jgi:hypothetical protein
MNMSALHTRNFLAQAEKLWLQFSVVWSVAERGFNYFVWDCAHERISPFDHFGTILKYQTLRRIKHIAQYQLPCSFLS